MAVPGGLCEAGLLRKPTKRCWNQICMKVNHAAVFMDQTFAESLHWSGGLMQLLNHGAETVKEFSSFESGSPSQKKAVFLVAGILDDTKHHVLRDIVQSSSFQYVIVVSSVSAEYHTLTRYGPTTDPATAFHQLEDDLLMWMGNANFTAEVIHIPLSMVAVTPYLFVTSEHQQFPLLLEGLDKQDIGIKGENVSDVDISSLPKEELLKLKLFVSGFNSFLEDMNVAEDCYSLGPASKLIAAELATLQAAKQRRKSAQQKASVLFVDRCLDLASVVGHHRECILDRLIMLLPRLPGHTNDIAIDMAPLCSLKSEHASYLPPGCLANSDSQTGSELIDALATSKPKEALMKVNRHLVESASQNDLKVKLSGKPGRVTADQLQTHIQLFRRQSKAIKQNSSLLQLGQACVNALRHPDNAKHDSLLAVEKVMLQNLSDPDVPSPLSQIRQMLLKDLEKPLNEREHSIEDILLLALYVFSLVGDDCGDMLEEKQLQQTLTRAILEADNAELPDYIIELVEDSTSAERISTGLHKAFSVFQNIGTQREELKQLSEIVDRGTEISPASLQPLLKQVIELITDPARPDVTDITYTSTGLKDLLKSGFGLFMNIGKPRLGDQPLLILYVVGGVTVTEVRQIKEVLSSRKSSLQVMVGGCSLLKPTDVLQNLFCNPIKL